MAARKDKEPSEQNAQTLTIVNDPGKSEQRKLAEVLLSPDILNTLTIQSFTKPAFGEIDFAEAVTVMKQKSEKIIAGDLSELESTLTATIASLNAIFNTLARKAVHSEYLNQIEVSMRLALKAQAQCARTVEILAEMKNPPIVFAKQANIAQGHQQINNGNQSPTHAGKTKILSNELLSEDNHAALDTRGTIETGRTHQELATVETIDGR